MRSTLTCRSWRSWRQTSQASKPASACGHTTRRRTVQGLGRRDHREEPERDLRCRPGVLQALRSVPVRGSRPTSGGAARRRPRPMSSRQRVRSVDARGPQRCSRLCNGPGGDRQGGHLGSPVHPRISPPPRRARGSSLKVLAERARRLRRHDERHRGNPVLGAEKGHAERESASTML